MTTTFPLPTPPWCHVRQNRHLVLVLRQAHSTETSSPMSERERIVYQLKLCEMAEADVRLARSFVAKLFFCKHDMRIAAQRLIHLESRTTAMTTEELNLVAVAYQRNGEQIQFFCFFIKIILTCNSRFIARIVAYCDVSLSKKCQSRPRGCCLFVWFFFSY